MAKKGQKDESKYQHQVTDDSLNIIDGTIIRKTKTVNSRRKANKEYEKKIEQITVRLPQGSRDKLNKYITESKKYTSVNAMMKELIENELGESLD